MGGYCYDRQAAGKYAGYNREHSFGEFVQDYKGFGRVYMRKLSTTARVLVKRTGLGCR